MSTASTSACTGRSPAPSVSTIRRRVESARTSNTTDCTRDVYTYVYIHFSAFLEQSQGFYSRGRRVSIRKRPFTWSTRLIPRSVFTGSTGDPMERSKRGKETAVGNRNLQERLVCGVNLNLANMTSLAPACKKTHWKLQGPGVPQLPVLFGRFAHPTRDY